MFSDIDNLYNQHEARCSGSRIRHDADIPLSTSSLKSEACHDPYDKLKIEYKDIFTLAHSYLSCPDSTSLVENVDDLMKKLLDKASADFEPKVTSTSGSSASACNTDHAVPHYQSRLKLDLSTFSGDVLDWSEVWFIFSTQLNRETSLSEHA